MPAHVVTPCVGVSVCLSKYTCVSHILPFFHQLFNSISVSSGQLRMEFLISSDCHQRERFMNGKTAYGHHCNGIFFISISHSPSLPLTHTQTHRHTIFNSMWKCKFGKHKKPRNYSGKKYLLIYAHFRSFIFNRLGSTSFIPSVRLTH